MTETQYTHVTIVADDVTESAEFYADILGMDRIPTVNFDQPVQWLDCGDLQLHLVETAAAAPEFNHFGVHVDDFESVYRAVEDHEAASVETLGGYDDVGLDGEPHVYYLPTGTVQMYVRDPAGNMFEVNYPDVDDLDPSVVPNTIERTDLTPPGPDEEPADVYGAPGLEL